MNNKFIYSAPIQVRLFGTEEHPYELGHFLSDGEQNQSKVASISNHDE